MGFEAESPTKHGFLQPTVMILVHLAAKIMDPAMSTWLSNSELVPRVTLEYL